MQSESEHSTYSSDYYYSSDDEHELEIPSAEDLEPKNTTDDQAEIKRTDEIKTPREVEAPKEDDAESKETDQEPHTKKMREKVETLVREKAEAHKGTMPTKKTLDTAKLREKSTEDKAFVSDKTPTKKKNVSDETENIVDALKGESSPKTKERSAKEDQKEKVPKKKERLAKDDQKEKAPEKSALLIINPQNDFYPANGDIKKGSIGGRRAKSEMKRLLQFMCRTPEIGHVIIHMGNRPRNHIGHPSFWIDDFGKHPKPYTVITLDDIENDKWQPVRHRDAAFVVKYAKRLQKYGRPDITIWPYHVIKGTRGHEIVPELKNFIDDAGLSVEYIEKAESPYTEFYSVFKAEVPLKNDPSTQLDRQLINRLKGFDRVYISGVLLSHCVNHSVRDLIANWPKRRMKDLILLRRTSSWDARFTDIEEDFLTFAHEAGITVE